MQGYLPQIKQPTETAQRMNRGDGAGRIGRRHGLGLAIEAAHAGLDGHRPVGQGQGAAHVVGGTVEDNRRLRMADEDIAAGVLLEGRGRAAEPEYALRRHDGIIEQFRLAVGDQHVAGLGRL